jgi:hypothetical protein
MTEYDTVSYDTMIISCTCDSEYLSKIVLKSDPFISNNDTIEFIEINESLLKNIINVMGGISPYFVYFTSSLMPYLDICTFSSS